ncbi:terminase small subunit [Neorhizobium sp. P12A]|uniref:terminase small subunit n=1 Tax=Neorhizobium sp. P12A TaxID=2268027 RepID=UPI0011ED0C81|nr:terminase small subunit [Neorhizobium sp. P12A]KAA0699979.1 terminase small subunit [Neorhizobium sp. P12A]
MTNELTAKQSRFSVEYLIDLNATQAAIRAGYSEKSAADIGAELLINPGVRSAISDAIAARTERTQITSDWVLERLADDMEADIADLFGDDNQLLPVDEWPMVFRKGLVSGCDIEERYGDSSGGGRMITGRVIKLRFSDRLKRLELIGRHVSVNAFRDVIEVRGLSGLADRLARAAMRADVEAVQFTDVTPPLPAAAAPG